MTVRTMNPWIAAFVALAMQELEPPTLRQPRPHMPRARSLNQRQVRRDARRSGVFSARKRRNK